MINDHVDGHELTIWNYDQPARSAKRKLVLVALYWAHVMTNLSASVADTSRIRHWQESGHHG